MPRGGGRGGRGSAGGGGGYSSPQRRAPLPQPTPKPPQSKPTPPVAPAKPYSPKLGGLGSTIAGTFIGSALGTVLGNAISSRMYEGRDPNTGQWTDTSREDPNPCKKQLDYFLQCARFAEDQSYCRGASDALKKCAEEHKASEDIVKVKKTGCREYFKICKPKKKLSPTDDYKHVG